MQKKDIFFILTEKKKKIKCVYFVVEKLSFLLVLGIQSVGTNLGCMKSYSEQQEENRGLQLKGLSLNQLSHLYAS